mmetsp:Transcript_53835/g.165636  ORF Transcript_53835/g.165636 Transcript_53835/m.165636 type:complete len:296 (-) Transcript_53835:98-985(-)
MTIGAFTRLATLTSAIFAATILITSAASQNWVSPCPGLSVSSLPIFMWVPTDPSLGGSRTWLFDLCDGGAGGYSCVQQNYYGKIVESYSQAYSGNNNGNYTACPTFFTQPVAGVGWQVRYGGLNQVIEGRYVSPYGDRTDFSRLANVTLVCDPSATSAFGATPVHVWTSATTNDIVWNYDFRINTSVACGKVPPPSGKQIVVNKYPASAGGCRGNSTTEMWDIGTCYPRAWANKTQAAMHHCVGGNNKYMYTYGYGDKTPDACISASDTDWRAYNVSQCYNDDDGYMMVTQCPEE